MGATDRIRLVFEAPVDPSTVRPAAFRVVTRDGRWAVPERAYLDPADRPLAGWSVVLEGDFGVAAHGVPWSVTVVAPLYGQDGSDFRGAGVEILEPQAPVRVRAVVCLDAEAVPSCSSRPVVVVADGPVPWPVDDGGVAGTPFGEALGKVDAAAVRLVCTDPRDPVGAVVGRLRDAKAIPDDPEPPVRLGCGDASPARRAVSAPSP